MEYSQSIGHSTNTGDTLALRKLRGEKRVHHALESAGVGGRQHIPYLGGTEVIVVDAVQAVVLLVLAECVGYIGRCARRTFSNGEWRSGQPQEAAQECCGQTMLQQNMDRQKPMYT